MIYYLIFLYICCFCICIDAIFDEYRAVRAYQAGDFKTAQQLLEPLFVHNQHDAQVSYNLGKIAYKNSTFAQAEVYFQRAAQHAQDPQLQLQSYFDLGNSQVQQKKWHEALANYESVIAKDPEHKEALDMIEQIKKILEQQQQNKQEDQKKDQQNNDKQQKDNQQGNKDDNTKNNNEQNDKNDNNNKNDQQDGKNESNQSQGQNKEREQSQSDAGNNSPQMNKEQPSQNSNNQATEDNFDSNKREKEREQKREEHKQGEQKQQPQGKPDLPPENVGDNHSQGKQDDSSSHEKSSPLAPQKASSQDTVQQKKEQAAKNKQTDKEELLLSLLEEKDAQLIKKMLKAQVMQEMPRTHGQKNW